jgi:subtilisin family serine protease
VATIGIVERNASLPAPLGTTKESTAVAPLAAPANSREGRTLSSTGVGSGYTWDGASTTAAGTELPRVDTEHLRRAANSREPLTGQAALDPTRVSRRLAAMVTAAGARPVELIVRHAPGSSGLSAAQIASVGGRMLGQYLNFPFTAALVPANRVAELSRATNVGFMDLNARVYSASAAARQTAYVPASGSGTSYPVSGSLGVAVVDSGVAAHPDLNVVERVSFNNPLLGYSTYLFDGFYDADYRESDGSDSWSQTPWVEKNDDGAEATGKVRIQTGNCPYAAWEQCLELSANSTTTLAIERSAYVIGARQATLSFEHQVKNITSTAAFVLEASSNGGLTWTTVKTFDSVYNSVSGGNFSSTVDLTPFMSPLMKIRFRVTDTDPTATLTLDMVDLTFRTTTYFGDTFSTTSYTASAGTETWPAGWTESGESTSASKDKIRIESHSNCPTGGSCLRLDANSSSSHSVQRALNLGGVFSAVLSFDYRLTTSSYSGGFAVEVSKDGGATWTELDRIDLNDGSYTHYDMRYDLTPHMAADTRIRFRVANAAGSTALRIDNLEVNIDRGNPNDALGHGTHIAGIIGGNGGSTGQQPGVARGARIHQVRVLDGRGRGSVADLLAGLDWLYSNGASRGIRIVNLSLGTAVTQSIADDPLVYAVERLWDAGFVVVVSAGNYGIFGNMTITSPGTARKVITVGSLTDSSTGTNFADDYVSLFSSRGPTLIDHVLKPDLIAPGNRYVSTVSADSRLLTLFPILQWNCGTGCSTSYMTLSGTSMAAAQVSGAVALMLSQQPNLSPATVKARLMRSARKIEGSDPTATGAGVLNVPAALADTGVIQGQALSPLMARSEDGSAIMVEDTAQLWGSPTWGAGYLWQNGYLWSNNYTASSGYLWSDGYLWQNGYLWSNGYLWNNGYLWQNGYLWNNGYLWEDAVGSINDMRTASVSSVLQIGD